jgi:glyoxylase-like metal-dependent hydrolase (beta-lactamase superfamily II)
MDVIDLEHLGTPNAIGVWRVADVIVDCGPSTCLKKLMDGLGGRVPRSLLLTHIHLDHAGAAGALVQEWPDLAVYVHAVGAPHLADPERLLRSAARLYGEDMDRLWGPVAPVPERNIRILEGGETVEGFEVAHTPGHASHHLAYRHLESGCAFVGDATGVRILPADLIMPHAPPPDIDLDAWFKTIDVLEDWRPEALALPHYGLVEDVGAHLDLMRLRLREKADLARAVDEAAFVARAEAEISAMDESVRKSYIQTSPAQHMYMGLRRYWDKHGGLTS